MKKIRTILVALWASLALLLPSYACESSITDSHDKIADDAITQIERIATVIATVKDQVSAEKAVTDIKDVTVELKKLGERSKSLVPQGQEENKKMNERVKPRMLDVQKKLSGAMDNLKAAGPEAVVMIMKGVSEFAAAAQELNGAFQAEE